MVAIGRKRPVASAKPVTAPVASSGRVGLTIAHTPEVPIETDTSPGALGQAERRAHVVPGAGGDRGAGGGAGHDLLRGAGQTGQLEGAAQRQLDQLGLPLLGGGGVVAGAGGVAAVGEGLGPLLGQVEGDVVVREQHARGALRVLGLARRAPSAAWTR